MANNTLEIWYLNEVCIAASTYLYVDQSTLIADSDANNADNVETLQLASALDVVDGMDKRAAITQP